MVAKTTWEEVNALDWGRYNDQIRFLALQFLRWSKAVALDKTDKMVSFVWSHKISGYQENPTIVKDKS